MPDTIPRTHSAQARAYWDRIASGANLVPAALQFMWPMATTGRTRTTVEEFLTISEGDPRRLELVDGEIVVVSEPRLAHGLLQAQLIGALAEWQRRVPGRARVAGPTGVHLRPHDAYGPDVVVSRSQPRVRCAGLPRRGPAAVRRDPVADDLAQRHRPQEVRLRGLRRTRALARRRRRRVVLVFRRSAPDVTYYDPALELTAQNTLDSPPLPGFTLALAELFAAP